MTGPRTDRHHSPHRVRHEHFLGSVKHLVHGERGLLHADARLGGQPQDHRPGDARQQPAVERRRVQDSGLYREDVSPISLQDVAIGIDEQQVLAAPGLVLNRGAA